MLIDTLFVTQENQPILTALHRILSHTPGHLTLTGSIALEAHLVRRGIKSSRIFGDVDIIINALDDLPATLADDFIYPHVHPFGKQGDLLIQLVNPQDAVRLDAFCAIGNAFLRAQQAALGSNKIFIISCEDLMAKTTTLLMKISRGSTIAAKHARDFSLLFPLVSDAIEDVWLEYRNNLDPPTFRETAPYVSDLILTHSHALIDPCYNKDVTAKCPKCQSIDLFKPADPQQVFKILGYV